jgi:hypothetical protein
MLTKVQFSERVSKIGYFLHFERFHCIETGWERTISKWVKTWIFKCSMQNKNVEIILIIKFKVLWKYLNG